MYKEIDTSAYKIFGKVTILQGLVITGTVGILLTLAYNNYFVF